MTTKAILFDLDGTLLDTAQNFQLILNQFRLENHLPPVDLEAVRLATSHGLIALVSLGWNTEERDPQFDHYRKQFIEAYKLYTTEQPILFFKGIEQILQLIHQHNIPWGIVTNKHAQFTRAITARHPILNSAGTIISGDTLEHRKPHPEPILYACNELFISPEYCMFIGDHQKDIQAGKSAGTSTAVALYGYLSPTDNPKSWDADYNFKNPDEIYQWIKTTWKLKL